ncbi:MAG: homoserine dehydrogenase, partial [Clostridia bacterium]|nr:homoserine dehydrogenase [Clostridia bacterium]
MLNIAIIGFGVVGGGVAEVIEKNSIEIEKAVGDRVFVKYILDLRDFPDSPYAGRVVKEIAPILEDPDVSVVVETMGGSHPAYEYSIAAMEAGKSVVTSNKEVVSVYGKELLSCASSHGVSYLFEASVGGGIPLIRSLRTSLRGDTICRIDGIMNGTTNFILTKMRKEGRDYAEVLREAQARGYAERNPKADVEGIDTQRKIIILTALSSGKLLDSSSVHTEPMTGITIEDFDDAARLGCSIKLIGSYRKKEDGRVVAWVIPCLVPSDHPLFAVDDVYNAVLVESPV